MWEGPSTQLIPTGHQQSRQSRGVGDGVSKSAFPTHLQRQGRRWPLHRRPWPFLAAPPTPLSPSSLGEGRWAEIGLSTVFLAPQSTRPGIERGCPSTEAGADPVAPMDGRASPWALPIPSSPTCVSGACFAHRGGEAPPGPPLFTAPLMAQLRCPSTSSNT